MQQLLTAEPPKPKRKRGRPTNAERARLENGEHWARVMTTLYEEGASDVEVCQKLKIPFKEFERRFSDDKDFATLVEYGRLASKAWWLELGRKAVLKKNSYEFNFWWANMKNRYGWSDKVENVSDMKPFDQLSKDELESQLLRQKDKIMQILHMKNIPVDSEESLAV